MSNKEEIFDWVISFEDEALKNVREEVIKTAEFNFGQVGREVAEKYYRQIDGEEDFDSDIKTDCDECKEKAKKLIENVNFLKECNENLTSDKINSYFVDFKEDIFINQLNNILKYYLDDIKKQSCIKINTETEKDILRRLLLIAAKRIQKNDNSM